MAVTDAYFTLLPRRQYTDPAVFEAEFERVFARQWLFAGHVSQLPTPGDYLVEEIAGESVLVVRTPSGEIRAFFNVCRHRGYPVCEGTCGNVKRFVCSYHSWVYSLDGELTGAAATPDGECGIDYGNLSLFDVHVTVFHGLIYVCLGDERPAELVDTVAEWADGVEVYDLPHTKEVFREAYEVRANWKTMLENYLECHHCTGNHKALGQPMDLGAMFDTTSSWLGEYFGGAMPLKAGTKTASLSGDLVSIPLGSADPERAEHTEGMGWGIVPTLSRIIIHVDHFVVHFLRPVAVDEVVWQSRWYVNDRAVEGVDYDLDRVTEVWRITNREDVDLCEGAYRGVRSRRFTSGPIHAVRESAIKTALTTYEQMMA
mgnify:CR=1 FL=1